MKIKVDEASGPVLNWMIAEAEGLKTILTHRKPQVLFPNAPRFVPFMPSTDWAQGGPIIEREIEQLHRSGEYALPESKFSAYSWNGEGAAGFGPTPLIAAMRCYAVSKLGEEVEVPDELIAT